MLMPEDPEGGPTAFARSVAWATVSLPLPFWICSLLGTLNIFLMMNSFYLIVPPLVTVGVPRVEEIPELLMSWGVGSSLSKSSS
jgi:hypothetical protein